MLLWLSINFVCCRLCMGSHKASCARNSSHLFVWCWSTWNGWGWSIELIYQFHPWKRNGIFDLCATQHVWWLHLPQSLCLEDALKSAIEVCLSHSESAMCDRWAVLKCLPKTSAPISLSPASHLSEAVPLPPFLPVRASLRSIFCLILVSVQIFAFTSSGATSTMEECMLLRWEKLMQVTFHLRSAAEGSLFSMPENTFVNSSWLNHFKHFCALGVDCFGCHFCLQFSSFWQLQLGTAGI